MPAPMTAQQKAAVSDFVKVAGIDRTTAARLLRGNAWNVQQTINAYYGNSPQKTTLSKLFDQYCDDPSSPDTIGMDGMMRYLGDLKVSVESIGLFVVSEIVKSPSMGEMKREKFIEGWQELGADTISKQQSLAKSIQSQLPKDPAVFKRVYRHTFSLGINSERARTIDLEMAIEFWKVLFSSQGWRWASKTTDWLALWQEYLLSNWKKGVNRDMWDQTYQFALKTMEDERLGFWSEDAAWPGVIDEFVVWSNEKRGVMQKDPDEMEM
ncbi:DUF298-domain-containing protein [Eremomyces bilateralis CBS 781.70]|uniref:Defective in cullin neddylation protein n=1 Tax=Eremomyces bilateralis CBS 781.70 TaxID=1392243 RepID=A0A6G1GCX6_9PEZI|nr:DUF298-domain-containing protein [Eremomyces bilateralis CBS 781.70]KAF1815756.1 DUF298-domain-containing protein [Eremomyces bilateralis CBS 781.70]